MLLLHFSDIIIIDNNDDDVDDDGKMNEWIEMRKIVCVLIMRVATHTKIEQMPHTHTHKQLLTVEISKSFETMMNRWTNEWMWEREREDK